MICNPLESYHRQPPIKVTAGMSLSVRVPQRPCSGIHGPMKLLSLSVHSSAADGRGAAELAAAVILDRTAEPAVVVVVGGNDTVAVDSAVHYSQFLLAKEFAHLFGNRETKTYIRSCYNQVCKKLV